MSEASRCKHGVMTQQGILTFKDPLAVRERKKGHAASVDSDLNAGLPHSQPATGTLWCATRGLDLIWIIWQVYACMQAYISCFTHTHTPTYRFHVFTCPALSSHVAPLDATGFEPTYFRTHQRPRIRPRPPLPCASRRQGRGHPRGRSRRSAPACTTGGPAHGCPGVGEARARSE